MRETIGKIDCIETEIPMTDFDQWVFRKFRRVAEYIDHITPEE